MDLFTKLLILDLDDTIFETKSIDPQIFDPLIQLIHDYASAKYDQETTEKITQALWHRPFDVVANKFNFSQEIIDSFYHTINQLSFDLNISTFPDYHFLKTLPFPKILVTTGFQSLQKAKIKALEIESDFTSIYIDDPSQDNRIYKKGIFTQIINQHQLDASQIWVIGDNPDSELKAGRTLGMSTIQIIKGNTPASSNADYHISSYETSMLKIVFNT